MFNSFPNWSFYEVELRMFTNSITFHRNSLVANFFIHKNFSIMSFSKWVLYWNWFFIYSNILVFLENMIHRSIKKFPSWNWKTPIIWVYTKSLLRKWSNKSVKIDISNFNLRLNFNYFKFKRRIFIQTEPWTL